MTELEPFHKTLRRATFEIHEQARESIYMDALFGERLDLAHYATLVAQYRHIYAALEDGADRLADHPVVGGFAVDELRRMPAIEADLAFLGHADPTPLPATAAYAARIRECVETWPAGWVAHHYTRYLGDIAGGQAVGTLLRRHYGLTGDGNRFYDFTDLGPAVPFRARYRALLDGAGWDAAERDRVVEESRHAFGLNVAMFAELADTVPQERLARPA